MLPEKTIRYKTHLKTALVEGLRDVFANHVDDPLRKTRVTVEWPMTENDYPTIIVRFFERTFSNAGVGHIEYITREGTTYADKFKHYFYKGDIEFAIFALDSVTRDLISDSLVQTLAMGDLLDYTNRFLSRVHFPELDDDPDSKFNYVSINTDEIQGFGESQAPAPWDPEDILVFQTSYRSAVFGECYSLPPTTPVSMIERVNFYPYIEGVDPVPEGADDPSEWDEAWPTTIPVDEWPDTLA